jgi:hypothetical protein
MCRIAIALRFVFTRLRKGGMAVDLILYATTATARSEADQAGIQISRNNPDEFKAAWSRQFEEFENGLPTTTTGAKSAAAPAKWSLKTSV